MDQRLLDALNNLSLALEELNSSFDSSKSGEAKSDVGAALQSGDFTNTLKEISVGVKSIKDDTTKILDNQETLIKLQKEQSKGDTKVFEESGQGKSKQMIKEGVSVIGLIAVAIVAIGTAFKLIGGVDFGTVIALSISLPILALTFTKIATTPGLDMSKIGLAAGTMVIMATALFLSSIPLSNIVTVGVAQFASAIGIAGVFTILSFGLSKIIKSFDGVGVGTAFTASLLMPVVFLALSYSISLSSGLLSTVKPMSLSQGFSAIMIAGVFAVISLSLGKLYNSLGKLNPVLALGVSSILPFVLVAVSYAIKESSIILSNVKSISLSQGITSILIAGVFTVISFGLSKLIKSFEGLNPATTIAASLLMPLVLVGLSYAIMESSSYFSKVKNISPGQFLTSLGISIVFVALSFSIKPIIKGVSGANLKDVLLGGLILLALTGSIVASSFLISNMAVVGDDRLRSFALVGITMAVSLIPLALTIKLINTLGNTSTMLQGGLSVLVLAGVISVSSMILGLGSYDNYPNLDWIVGVGLSIVAFGVSTLLLGSIIVASGGLGVLALASGSAAVLGLSALIIGTAEILSKGNFSGGPSVDWTTSVGGTLVAFASAVVILGVINSVGGVAETLSFGVVKNPIEAGSSAVIKIAETMNQVGDIVSRGNYSGGPSKEWSESISLSLGAFSPIYQMLVANKVISSLFGSGVTVEDFSSAINVVSQGIVSSAKFFAGNSTLFKGGPDKKWSEGVGLAIGAFAPVYEILAANSGWMKSDIKPEDFAGKFENGILVKDGAIQVIARGIVSAAKFFADNTSSFDLSLAPTKEWSEGVGGAISSFMPIFDIINGNSGFFGDDDIIEKLQKGIISISKSISWSAFYLSKGDYTKYPDKAWVDGIAYTIQKISSIDDIGKIATTFGLLGYSVRSFSDSIQGLDLGKLEAINSLSGSVVLLSLMDPDGFNDMMNKLEEKGGIFNKLLNDFEDKKNKSSVGLSVGNKVDGTVGELQLMSSKLDSMTAILQNISSVVSGDLRNYLLENTAKENTLDRSSFNRSDLRLKNIIRKIGVSLLGLNIYEFTYKFNSLQIYQGVIAQELLGTDFEDSLHCDKNGYYSVDYSKLDVEFKKINKVV